MDVGNPSNFFRIADLYGNDYNSVKEAIYGTSFTDGETRIAINDIYNKYSYLIDPHGAVGYLGALDYCKRNGNPCDIVILETAHPAKFADIIEPVINCKVDIPERLAQCLLKEKHSIVLSSDFSTFKEFLLSHS
jgi:threonine synthase